MKKCPTLVVAIFWCALLGAAEINWNNAQDVQTGVKLLKLERDEPRLMKINLMRIDLTTPGLQFTGTPRDPDWGKKMPDHDKAIIRTKRVRTRDFLLSSRNDDKLDMIVAANSAPWSPWEQPYTHKYANPVGLGILNGEVICDSGQHTAVFVIYQNGKADIVSSVPESDYPQIRLAASGFAIVLRDGALVDGGGYEKALHPRIAYGLSKDRNFLYIITIDGRQKEWSLGATGLETAQFLKDAGAFDAINMDGGGSATLCYWDGEAQKVVTVNRHTAGGYERPVGSNIGIYLQK